MKNLRQARWALFWFGLLKIPLIRFCRPRLEHIDFQYCTLRIPVRRRTKNHLGGLYIGAYAVGADLACGFLGFYQIRNKKLKASIAFKSLRCDFERRAESDVYFKCESGDKIAELIEESTKTGERVNYLVPIEAYTFENNVKEVVSQIKIELSLKVLKH